ncbi:related to Uridylate kinase [Saccharomycodes ludwigii]|uniref:Uridylate kinase n=1 Tax=Saccharomycodes ludwigii TaxID=36035 RepID=A0A376B270_9ASCO|nr:related to Uridylate kinase [Saccharomycodes ludwigii]
MFKSVANNNDKKIRKTFHNKNSNAIPNLSTNSNPNKNTSNKRKSKILLVLGLLAVGSSLFSISYQKSPPQAFLEEVDIMSKEESLPKNLNIIFVLGGPGVGKGTQCDKIVKDYGFVHLSAGDLLRAEQSRPNSEYGELIKNYIKEGLIVPQEVTIQLLKNAILENYNKSHQLNFLIDGFPRKMDQAITFEKTVHPCKFVLFFDCSEKVMLERLLKRSKTSGRDDDNMESIKKRFKTFVETSMPVIQYFEQQYKVVKINCEKSVEEVYKDVQNAIKDHE